MQISVHEHIHTINQLVYHFYQVQYYFQYFLNIP